VLVISYGMPKSGSTLAFELACGLLESAGYRQSRLPAHLVARKRRVNFLDRIVKEELIACEAAGRDDIIMLKTHQPLPPELVPLLDERHAAGQLAIHAVCRDPREMCLSLLDAGRVARSKGRGGFSAIETIDDALRAVRRRIKQFRVWAAVENALILRYDTFAFEPDAAIEQMRSHLRVAGDPEAAKKYAFEEAFTQKNLGVPARYEQLPPEDNARILSKLGWFLEEVYQGDVQEWQRRNRDAVLRGTA
jgi:hypothetical protein